MNVAARYPQYAPIARHIEAAQLERIVVLAEALADFIADCWKSFLAGPRPAAVIIELPPAQFRTYASL
jgi:hypothetical protein